MKVVKLSQYRTEKQYKAVGAEWSYNPSMDDVAVKHKKQWTEQEYIKAYMKLLSK